MLVTPALSSRAQPECRFPLDTLAAVRYSMSPIYTQASSWIWVKIQPQNTMITLKDLKWHPCHWWQGSYKAAASPRGVESTAGSCLAATEMSLRKHYLILLIHIHSQLEWGYKSHTNQKRQQANEGAQHRESRETEGPAFPTQLYPPIQKLEPNIKKIHNNNHPNCPTNLREGRKTPHRTTHSRETAF